MSGVVIQEEAEPILFTTDADIVANLEAALYAARESELSGQQQATGATPPDGAEGGVLSDARPVSVAVVGDLRGQISTLIR